MEAISGNFSRMNLTLAAPGSASVSPDDLLNHVDASLILNKEEKKYCKQMAQCVAQYGIDNHRELFKAAGYCLDTKYGSKYNNMISVEEYMMIIVGADTDEQIALDATLAHDRPGIFLLQPSKNVYFLKENNTGSLVYYDPKADQFVDSSSLTIQGKDFLVILNKTKCSEQTYFGEKTPDRPIRNKFYHEMQDAGKCGIHACHAFLGYPGINLTQFTLLKLEKMTQIDTPAKISIYCKQNNFGRGLSDLPSGQVRFFEDQVRFDLAQTSLSQSDAGNAPEDILALLKLMAMNESIESKYAQLTIHYIDIQRKHLTFAKEQGVLLDNQTWQEKDLPLILEALDKKCQENKPALQKLEHQTEQMQKDGSWKTKNAEFMHLVEEKGNYQVFESMKDRVANSIEGIAHLRKQLKEMDRLLISSTAEDHFYTLRKCENGDWILIDSLLSEQEKIDQPFEWIMKQIMQQFTSGQACNHTFIGF